MKCGFCDRQTDLKCICGKPVCQSHIYVIERGKVRIAVCQDCKDNERKGER